MNRSVLLKTILAATTVGVAFGCNENDKKTDADKQASMQKYKILSGNTSDASAARNDPFTSIKEPALNPETRFAAGQLAESEDRADCAIIQYEQALRLDPKHVPSLYRMGVVLTKLKRFDVAVAMWNRYIEATGGIASGYSNLGFCYEMAGNIDAAEEAYKKGLAIDPKSGPCRTNYGLMLARQNRKTEAEVQLSAVLPQAEVNYNLAAVYEQQGALGQAREELKKALEVNPNMTEAQMKLATLPQD